MRVYSPSGEVVAESPVREPEQVAQEVLRDFGATQVPAETSLLCDAANLAPVTLELEAVRRYAACGSLAKVSRELGIAIYELQKLQRTQWWQTELAALRREQCAIQNARLSRIHDLTLDQLEDRLEHGDLVARGRGFVRQKLSGRDLARIADSVFKQRQLLNGEPTEIRDNGQLEKLARKLAALGGKDPDAARRIVESEAVDVTAREVHTTAVSGQLGAKTTSGYEGRTSPVSALEYDDTRETVEGDA